MESTPGIYLLLTNAPRSQWRHPIETRRKIIGRARQAQISIPAQLLSVSRRHAEVWADEKGCWIRDLGSQAGTKLNGIAIGILPKARLMPGDLLLLGEAEIQVVSESSYCPPAADNQADGDEPTHTGLENVSDAVKEAIAQAKANGQAEYGQPLSPAETELLIWVGRGILGDEELGRRLYRSPNTVRTQIGSVLRKLGLHSRAEIVVWIRSK